MHPTANEADADAAEAMAAHGIERVPVDYFHWNGFRYSTLKDALAAARRERTAGTDA